MRHSPWSQSVDTRSMDFCGDASQKSHTSCWMQQLTVKQHYAAIDLQHCWERERLFWARNSLSVYGFIEDGYWGLWHEWKKVHTHKQMSRYCQILLHWQRKARKPAIKECFLYCNKQHLTFMCVMPQWQHRKSWGLHKLSCVVDSEAGIYNRVNQEVEITTAYTTAPGQSWNFHLFRFPLSSIVSCVMGLIVKVVIKLSIPLINGPFLVPSHS